VDAPATPAQKAALSKLAPAAVTATELAGEPITAKLARARQRRRSAASRCRPARLVRRTPSGTEDVYKLYAESAARSTCAMQAEARAVVAAALGDA
jgi:phosphoglucomutase